MSIKSIDTTSVHRITSGQVVIDLQTAVKELVENSLDAGATSIDVRFKEYGIRSIEVIDNGHGIPEEDYDSIALKHHTSKLASFEDLGTVLTFGFRGEALSSLCALSSSVTVTTATAVQTPMGTVLEFEQSGRVKDKSGKAARKRGTTVMISGLFTPLPVRRKEFERNAKREYGKALTLLHAYALVPCTKENRGVRLTVSNHPDKGSRSVQIRTDGTPSLKASVSTLWGPKSFDNTVPLDLHLEVEAERSSVLKKRGVQQDGITEVQIKGLISKFSPGCGRTSSDRQFFYVNGRPCNPSKVQKAFNEIYRSFNTNQVPFVIADFQLPTKACDINVSPDKRTIFIHSENNLIQALKTKLEEAFSPARSTYSVNGASSMSKESAGSKHSNMEINCESSLVTDNDRSHHHTHQEDEENPTRIDDVAEDEENACVPRDQRDRARRTNQLKEGVSKASASCQSAIANKSRTSRSRSRSIDVTESVVDEEESEHRHELEDVDMTSPDEDPDEAALADGVPTSFADRSISIDVDLSDCEGGKQSSHMPSPRSRPRTPLFAPSPSPSQHSRSQSPPISRAASSPTSDRGRTESPSPQSSEADDLKEPPRKRLRMNSPLPTMPKKSRPVQLVLGTSGAAWNLQGEGEKGVSDDKMKAHIANAAGNARDKIRTRLGGFAMSGSQTKPIPVDDEEVSAPSTSDRHRTVQEMEGVEPDDEQGVRVDVEGTGLNTDIIPSTQETEAQTSRDVEASQGNSDNFSTAGTGPSVIDLTETELMDEDSEFSGVQQNSVETPGEGLSRPEIIRTSSANLILRLDLDRLSSIWSCLRSASVLGAALLPRLSPSQSLHASANVANANDAEGAERELTRVIHKEDFASMHILGQFNLGFIITRRVLPNNAEGKRGADDLFIVDQHAADEKYNFETLQQTTKIESQKLFQPRSLELTAADELLAIDNVDILRKNGFEVMIDENACTGHRERVKLVAQPVSKGTTFDMKDLEELLHLMQDQPSGQMVRCSKARAMFAMRACRKSVMVGMPLAMGQMTSVVRHMGTMEQPWNCPHGRPTMRHLVNLSGFGRTENGDREVEWAKFTG